MHLLIGYLAIRLAWGLRGADADQTGALQTVADGPGGAVLLWTIGLGMLALALWQAGEVLLWWHGLFDPAHRMRVALVCAKCLAKGAVYAVLGVTALLFAVGLEYEADERLPRPHRRRRSTSPAARCSSAASRRRSSPSASTRWSAGITGGFMKDIDLPAAPDRWEPLIEGIGRVGYVAKGIAFALVGALLWRAATSADVVHRHRPGRRARPRSPGSAPGRGCSPRSGSGSPRSGSTRWPAPATPTATRRPEVRPSGRRRRR